MGWMHMADRIGAIARAWRPLLAALALATGLTQVAGMPVAPAEAVAASAAAQLSQGVAKPSVSATQEPQAGGASASSSSSATASQATPPANLGFDACATPSQRAMNAWASSPYRVIGVYVGGANRACSQPNLTTEWVTAQISAGWRLIPTYVGLQAPTSSCGSCAKLSANASKATAQGTAAAEGAVADAEAVGIGAGNPVYFDMEAYAETTQARSATLAFLAAWTSKLHALGYLSGVYSSSASGIADLSSQLGTAYPEPDDVWIAEWNGRLNTEAPFVPSYAWAPHRRLHQYRGGHNETYGGVTINVDNDYVDGDVVGGAAAVPPLTVSRVRPSGNALSVTIGCGLSPEASCVGQILLHTHVMAPVRGAPGAKRAVRVAVARRGFKLGGGRSHAFLVVLNPRGRPLLRKRGKMKTQLLVAIPGARVTRAVLLGRLG
jgi:Domain of unknown function (DUF1906)